VNAKLKELSLEWSDCVSGTGLSSGLLRKGQRSLEKLTSIFAHQLREAL